MRKGKAHKFMRMTAGGSHNIAKRLARMDPESTLRASMLDSAGTAMRAMKGALRAVRR